MEIIKKAKDILKNSGAYSVNELIKCINDLVYTFEGTNEKIDIQNLAVEITKQRKLIADKLNRKEIDYPSAVLDGLRKTPIIMLTEKYDGGQFSGIDSYQYKYNGLVYTFALEGTYIIEAYTENEID